VIFVIAGLRIYSNILKAIIKIFGIRFSDKTKKKNPEKKGSEKNTQDSIGLKKLLLIKNICFLG
jgi:hypothetical protein